MLSHAFAKLNISYTSWQGKHHKINKIFQGVFNRKVVVGELENGNDQKAPSVLLAAQSSADHICNESL